MSKNLSLLFSTPLWSFQIDDPKEINKRLLDAVKVEQKIDDGVNLSNQGGWQSHGRLHFKDEFQILVDVINNYLVQAGKDYGFGALSSNLKVTSMWANVNPEHGSNAIHSHQSPTGTPNPLIISGCYYIKVPPNSGQFVLEDFSRPMRYLQLPFQEANQMNSFTIKIQPRAGDLLMFPAWMEHGVEENRSVETRVSIAFNVALIQSPVRKY